MNTHARTTASPVTRLVSLLGAVLLAVSLLSVGSSSEPAEAALGTIGTPGYLGDAESFAVVAGTAITNDFSLALPVPQTLVDGDMAVSPGTSVTGFGGGQGQVTVGSTIYTAPSVTAAAAKADADLAFIDVGLQVPETPTSDANLGGLNLGPGVYVPPVGNFGLTGTLTLTGDWDDIFVFKTFAFSTGVGNSVVVLDGANPCNIYWHVDSSADLAANTTFVGTLLAGTSITVGSETDVEGRLFAGTGNVTLIHDQIETPTCLTAPAAGGGTGGGSGGSELADTGAASLPVFALGGAALVVLLGAALAARGRRSTLA